MGNYSNDVRIANKLSLIGMVLGIISAAYSSIMFEVSVALLLFGRDKAIIALAIGIVLSVVALVLSITALITGATSKTFYTGICASAGGLIVSTPLLIIFPDR